MSRKGTILITFAWAMEIVGVAAGMVNSLYTTFPYELPKTLWAWLPAIPMLILPVAELGRVPLASVLFYRHRLMQVVALSGMLVLGYLAFENWTFGFERIVQLRLETVNKAGLALAHAEKEYKDLVSQRAQTAAGDSGKREELRDGIAKRQAALKAEAETHQNNLEAIRKACQVIREKCMVPRSREEDQRYEAAVGHLGQERDQLQSQIDDMVKADRGSVADQEKAIAAAFVRETEAKSSWIEEVNKNQIYRLAASFFHVDPSDVTPYEFSVARWVFSTFSALAVALAGSVAALVYYAHERLPGEHLFLAKLTRARRAYYARKRRPIFREVPVEKVIYRDGKEPPAIVEKEVVRWIDRIVLIPRWGVKYPIHANSLIRDDHNVAQLSRKVS
jgi:hypothetical protein